MNIYLDIDEVLIANKMYSATHANEFLKYILTKYPNSTYWLTTHRQGDANVPMRHSHYSFNDGTTELMNKINLLIADRSS